MLSKRDMHGYQSRTATMLYESDVVQAVVPMGGGKTVSAGTAIRELIDDGHIRSAIINAPKRVARLVWPAEFAKWEHLAGTKIVSVLGDPKERLEALREPAEVYITSRDNIKWLVEELKKLPDGDPRLDLLNIDELSRFKSPTSKLANKHLGKVIGRFGIRWGLTGTPRPNDYIDQYRPLQLLSNNGLFRPRAFTSWRQKHFMKVDGQGNPSDYGFKYEIRPESEHKIIRQIGSMSFTIDPAEMPELPELTVVTHWVDLPPAARRVYDVMERDLLAQVENGTVLAANAGVAAGKLDQIIQGFLYRQNGNHDDVEYLHTEKADTLVDLVEDLAGDPALLVYGFREDLRVMKALFDEPDHKLPYLGSGVSDSLAGIYEEEWNARRLPLLGLHPASAGHGLNLQHGGTQMIVYNMPWSAELYDQMIKRFHRQGQIRRCFLHLILARNTVDEVKFDRVVGKMAMQEAFTKYLRRV
jgi:SNF2 family DNA or RNA helicase